MKVFQRMRGILAVLAVALAMNVAAGPVRAQPLYTDESPVTSLFGDPGKARYIGDLVIIKVSEIMSTAKVDNLKTDRTFDSSAGTGKGILSGVTKLIGANGLDFGNKDNQRTERSDKFEAVFAAQVVAILPGGYLQIEGARDLKVERDKVTVSVSGIARPRDINREGEVVSSRLAEFQMVVKRTTSRGLLDSIVKILF